MKSTRFGTIYIQCTLDCHHCLFFFRLVTSSRGGFSGSRKGVGVHLYMCVCVRACTCMFWYCHIHIISQSTLLQCLLSELQLTSGSVKVTGRLSYTAQEPWLFSVSLRDNILFGSDYEPVRYNKILSACALNKVSSPNSYLLNLFFWKNC